MPHAETDIIIPDLLLCIVYQGKDTSSAVKNVIFRKFSDKYRNLILGRLHYFSRRCILTGKPADSCGICENLNSTALFALASCISKYEIIIRRLKQCNADESSIKKAGSFFRAVCDSCQGMKTDFPDDIEAEAERLLKENYSVAEPPRVFDHEYFSGELLRKTSQLKKRSGAGPELVKSIYERRDGCFVLKENISEEQKAGLIRILEETGFSRPAKFSTFAYSYIHRTLFNYCDRNRRTSNKCYLLSSGSAPAYEKMNPERVKTVIGRNEEYIMKKLRQVLKNQEALISAIVIHILKNPGMRIAEAGGKYGFSEKLIRNKIALINAMLTEELRKEKIINDFDIQYIKINRIRKNIDAGKYFQAYV